MKNSIIIGTLMALPLIATAGDFTPLGLKPGLWEATTTTKIQLSEAMLANIPPDRRGQMEAMMNGRADQKKNCQYNVVSSSATKQQVDVACTTDKGRTTGAMTFEATSPESGKAIMQMTQDGGTKVNININMRYLGADCGDVKPR